MRLTILIAVLCQYALSSPVPEPEAAAEEQPDKAYGVYGYFIGRLSDPQSKGISGDVFVVNRTCLQIIAFNYDASAPDLYFWADSSDELTSGGAKIPTFEFGDKSLSKYKDARVVLSLPEEYRVSDFRTVGLWCQSFTKNYGSVSIPSGLPLPKPYFLNGTIAGNTAITRNYGVKSGPVLVMDTRTVKVFGFHFNGDEAPDGNILVGKGPVLPENGVKAAIRGRDEPDNVQRIDQRYTGQDVILELPETHDVFAIDWISVYCIRFRVNFGQVQVGQLSNDVPAFVPVQHSYDEPAAERKPAWPRSTLLGVQGRTNFTFQLGPPAGRRAYEAWAEARPNEYVWYVNGYMTPELVLQRGVTYTFNIQGGDDSSTAHFYNPLYISDEPFGGYMKLPEDDRSQVTVYAGLTSIGKPLRGREEMSSGSLCLWSQVNPNENPDLFDDFKTYSDQLKLSCEKGKSGVFRWTPDESTKDTVYYQSYTNYYMGYKIMVTDEIPSDLPDASAIPYDYEIWLEHNGQNFVKVPRSAEKAKRATTGLASSSSALVVLFTALLLLLRW